MKAVILAGGLGKRLRPFTEVIPKPLLPLGEQSVMEVQILSLKNHGFDEIYVATNYRSEYVEAFLGNGSKYDVKLHFSRENKPLGTCGPLSLLKDKLTEPFIVMNGDILTKLNFSVFYDFAIRHSADLTLGTKVITTPFRFGNVTINEDGCIMHVEEKPEFKLEILAGIYCIKPSVYRYIPEDEYFGMDSLIKEMLGQNEEIARYLIEEYWLDMGQVEDYNKAREAYRKHFCPRVDNTHGEASLGYRV